MAFFSNSWVRLIAYLMDCDPGHYSLSFPLNVWGRRVSPHYCSRLHHLLPLVHLVLLVQERGEDVLGDLVARLGALGELGQLLVQHPPELSKLNII